MDKLASSVSSFSSKFVNELDELKQGKSAVASPLSAEVLLALLTLGATEPAHSELLKSLALESNDNIRKSFSKLSSSLKNVEGITLNVANKVYVKEGDYDLMPGLKKDAVDVFNAAFEKINFADGANSADVINKWVEEKTNERIKNLLNASDLNDDTRLVLINAIYFKGTWEKQFNPQVTRDQDFFATKEHKVKIPMMHQEANFKYGECDDLNAQLLEMSYVGGQASMLIILPREIDGLEGVVNKLANGYELTQIREKMSSTKVIVTIPKFKIETTIDLSKLLPKLGIKAIFSSDNSGLNKILSNEEPLYVSKAIQKAFIEVNEEGAEAAAATGMMMQRRAMTSPTFQADRPFIYAVKGPADIIFFTGTYQGDSIFALATSQDN